MSGNKQYVKKPIVVSAQLFKGYGATHQDGNVFDCKMIRHSYHVSDTVCPKCNHHFDDHADIPNLEGFYIACPGDYIIKGIQNEFYPVKPDIFHATYDLVGEEGSSSSEPDVVDKISEVLDSSKLEMLKIASSLTSKSADLAKKAEAYLSQELDKLTKK